MTKHAHETWILIVDDELGQRAMLRANLEQIGYRTQEVSSGRDAIAAVTLQRPDLVIMDLQMPEMNGNVALKKIRAVDRDVPILILTAHGTIESAVEAIKNGAYEYLEKPVDINDLREVVNNGLHFGELTRPGKDTPIAAATAFHGIIWRSALMEDILKTVSAVAPSDATVLITGESGTGKELIADAIQRLSNRADKPFVKVNCAALHEQLLESELFGHEKGAFTGALDQRKGRFELADSGTLFLDEIGDMAVTTQAKILRVLQNGIFERLGGMQTIQVDVRVIAATNKELKQAIEKNMFRKDLFYRLSVVPIHIPPLRERRDEIPMLVEHFLKAFSSKNRKLIKRVSPDALRVMTHYAWPGNIRELENAIERAVILTLGDTITVEALPAHVRGDRDEHPGASVIRDAAGEARGDGAAAAEALTLLEQSERDLIVQEMMVSDGNRTKAAARLGMSRRSLYTKLKRYGLDIGKSTTADSEERPGSPSE